MRLKATPSPTQGSIAEDWDENTKQLLSRLPSDTDRGKKPNLVFPWTCTAMPPVGQILLLVGNIGAASQLLVRDVWDRIIFDCDK